MSGEKTKITRVKDVVNAFLLKGVQGVEQLQREHGRISRRVLRNALKDLEAHGKAEDLERWCLQEHGFGLSNKGRRGPRIDEQRRYAILWTGKGEPFLRLPLSAYNITREEDSSRKADVRFAPEGPVVTV